jgi:hypothetical protein
VAVLRKKEIVGAQPFHGRIQSMIIEQDGPEDTAFRFEIVG